MFATASGIVKKDGVLGLYRGLGAVVSGIGSFSFSELSVSLVFDHRSASASIATFDSAKDGHPFLLLRTLQGLARTGPCDGKNQLLGNIFGRSWCGYDREYHGCDADGELMWITSRLIFF